MSLLIAGVGLWIVTHWFRRFAPAARARLGDPGKGIIAVLILVSLGAMIFGYRAADFVPIWQPPSFMVHINNLLMVIAFWIYGSSAAKGAKAWPAYKTRHPQLLGFKVWAIAHLLVNGDLASILLFGGLLGWAVGSVVLINRAEPEWTPPDPAGRATYIRLTVITIVIVSLVAAIHTWLGVWPFAS